MIVRINLAITLLLGVVLLAGCGQAPQQRYQAAVDTLKQARAAQSEAKATVAARQKALEQQRRKLEQAKNKLAQAREQLKQANQRVDEAVSDKVLFRAVQRAVLDSERFPEAAISVGVADRVVTLTGTVPDKATEKATLEAARDHPGVRDVRDELMVAGSASGGQSTSQS